MSLFLVHLPFTPILCSFHFFPLFKYSDRSLGLQKHPLLTFKGLNDPATGFEITRWYARMFISARSDHYFCLFTLFGRFCLTGVRAQSANKIENQAIKSHPTRSHRHSGFVLHACARLF